MSVTLGYSQWVPDAPPVTLYGDTLRKNVWISGGAQVGKTTLLQNAAIQAMRDGSGFAFLDPSGESIDILLRHVPRARVNDVIYINPTDPFPVVVNPLQGLDVKFRDRVASDIVQLAKSLWPDGGVMGRSEDLFQSGVSALLDIPHATLLHLRRLLVDDAFRRQRVLPYITNPITRQFWSQEYESWPAKDKPAMVAAFLNKVRALILSSPLRSTLCGKGKPSISTAIERSQILLVGISQKHIGKREAGMLGSLLLARIFSIQGQPFTVFCDGAEIFSQEILQQSGTTALWLVHPYADFLTDTPTKILFQSSIDIFRKLEFAQPGTLRMERMTDAPPFRCFVKTIQPLAEPQPVEIRTIPPFAATHSKAKERVLRQSRERFGTAQAEIDAQIERALASTHARNTRLVNNSRHPFPPRRGPRPGGASAVPQDYL